MIEIHDDLDSLLSVRVSLVLPHCCHDDLAIGGRFLIFGPPSPGGSPGCQGDPGEPSAPC